MPELLYLSRHGYENGMQALWRGFVKVLSYVKHHADEHVLLYRQV